MNKDLTARKEQHILTCIAVLSIAAIAFLTYRDMLGNFFTGLDTLNIIEESRAESFGDVLGLLNSPMTQEFAWYRPIAVMFYSITYAIWKLNPLGFYLTNLILHITVSVLVFFFVQFLTDNKRFLAWLTAVIFTTHPVHVDSIPALRMNDIIATMFLLPSLMLFIKYVKSELRNKGLLFFSLIFCALALGSKEIAITLPVLAFTYVMIFYPADGRSFKQTFIFAVKVCFPYFILAVIYLLIRASVLHGVGGYTSSFGSSGEIGIINIIRKMININILYFGDLLYPADFLRLYILFSPFQSDVFRAGFVAALLVFFSLLFFYKGAVIRSITDDVRGAVKIFKIFSAIGIILSVICILLYPLSSPYINNEIQKAYNGVGLPFLAGQMDNAGVYPLEFYIYETRDLLLRSFVFSLFFFMICYAVIHKRNEIKQYFFDSDDGNVQGFYLIWLLLPLGIYLLTVTFDHHDMYISVIPFTVMLSIIIVNSFQPALQKIKDGTLFFDSRIPRFITTAALAVSLFVYSPLFMTYGEWKDSGELSRMFLEKFSKIIPELPNDAVIQIYDFPEGISSYRKEIPRAKEVAYYAEFSIKAWLDMTYPSNRMDVFIKRKIELPVYMDSLDLELEYGKDNNVLINITYSKDENKNLKSSGLL